MTERTPERQQPRPPTGVTTLPVVLITFLVNVVIDLNTDWHMLLRWGVALAAGIVGGAICVGLWRAFRTRSR